MVVENAIWLPEAIRQDPVLARILVMPPTLVPGRPGSFFPSGQMNHHTACMLNDGHNPQSCLNVVRTGNSEAPGPICHVLVTSNPVGTRYDPDRPDPRLYYVSHGRCNHAGASAVPWNGLPGNGVALSYEVCGPPEQWSPEVVEVLERLNAAVLRNRRWGVHQVTTHWESATPRGRKIDPSGPWPGQPNLARLTPWSPDIFRTRVQHRLDNDMSLRTIQPYRVYDSRPGEQGKVHAALGEKNAAVPKTAISTGQSRSITLGMVAEATIQLTGICRNGAGYLAVDSPDGSVSAINLDTIDRVETIVLPCRAPGGAVTISAHGPAGFATDFAVDVRQVAP
jgi:hypothetical protein